MRKNLILLSLCEGLLASHHYAFFFLYTRNYNLDLLTYASLESFISLLFCINPIFGYISDRFALFGKRKKSYLIVMSVVGIFAYVGVSIATRLRVSVPIIFILHFVIDLSNSFRSVIIDSICVLSHNYHNNNLQSRKKKSANSSLMTLYGSRLTGKIASMSFFGITYGYFANWFFLWLAGIVMATLVISIFTIEPSPNVPPVSRSLSEKITEAVRIIKKNNLGLTMFANAIVIMSPNIEFGYKYFLICALHFTNSDFSLRSLISEFSIFVGILLVGTILKNVQRSSFLKVVFFLYCLWTLFLIVVVKHYASLGISPIILVLISVGVHSLLLEIKSIPFIGIFLERSPPNSDGFFIALIYFFNQIARNISNTFGSLFIYWLSITKTQFENLDKLIYIHVLFSLAGCFILLISNIPNKDKSLINYSSIKKEEESFKDVPATQKVQAVELMGSSPQDESLNEQTLFKIDAVPQAT